MSDSYEENRKTQQSLIKCELAKYSEKYTIQYISPHPINHFLNIFTKCLKHDNSGIVDKNQCIIYLEGLHSRNINIINNINYPGTRRFIDIPSSWCNDIIGRCNNTYHLPSIPPMTSTLFEFEMTELYCMALCRDIPFNCYTSNDIIHHCCNYLNYMNFKKVNPYNIFQLYESPYAGPYISQFLYHDIINGDKKFEQKYYTYIEQDYMTTIQETIHIQNGHPPSTPSPPKNIYPRYIINGRDLATYVHKDEPFEAYYNASLILTNIIGIRFPSNMFVNLGKADLHSMLFYAGRLALLAGWYYKWNLLIIRPEKLALEIELRNIYTNIRKCGILNHFKNKLLPQCYPEGSPTHPSFPSGHACIAGACITILKFFFDCSKTIKTFTPNFDGSSLHYTNESSSIQTELDKLAYNISLGRSWAGIHYRVDSIGIQLGEHVAIDALKNFKKRYNINTNIPITLTNCKTITI